MLVVGHLPVDWHNLLPGMASASSLISDTPAANYSMWSAASNQDGVDYLQCYCCYCCCRNPPRPRIRANRNRALNSQLLLVQTLLLCPVLGPGKPCHLQRWAVCWIVLQREACEGQHKHGLLPCCNV